MIRSQQNEFLPKLNKMKTIELAGWKRTNKKLSTTSGGANVVHVRVYLYQKKNEVHVKNKQPRSE